MASIKDIIYKFCGAKVASRVPTRLGNVTGFPARLGGADTQQELLSALLYSKYRNQPPTVIDGGKPDESTALAWAISGAL